LARAAQLGAGTPALMAANPLSADELAQLRWAQAGDLAGLVEHHDEGTTAL